ncbi:hypothetical protein GCM10009038_18410 [Salinicola rhizosphaerae]|uniref:Uncharacterized protein n=1 Tax=Salinicola rhizosphaerae TaxID=1443141 RepID=A0ABQ3E594_9GAMM|nr:hypothetical protein GCM10009038_18410 [Salinicola rhizosphaerae]
MDALGKHRRAAGKGSGDELGDCDRQIAAHCGKDDRFGFRHALTPCQGREIETSRPDLMAVETAGYCYDVSDIVDADDIEAPA